MKRIGLLLLYVSAVVCVAQNRFPPINLYPGDPTGNVCAGNLIQQSSTTGLIYTCQSGLMKVGGTSGALTPSPQFTFFYQPSPGTTAAAQGDPNFTTDGAGHITALSFAGAGTGLTGTAASLTAGHANNLPGDFATQSAATPAGGTFSNVAASAAVLGAVNNLANLASQTGVGSAAQFNSWLAAYINTRSFLAADPQAAAGSPTQPFTSNNHLVDYRGTGSPNGGPNRSNPGVPLLTLADGALGFYSAADKQQPLASASYANNVNFGFDCKAGGIYNFTGSAGTKSNCNDLYLATNFWTAAQKQVIEIFSASFSRGEHMGISNNTTDYGGAAGPGTEPNYLYRGESHQGSDTDGLGGVSQFTGASLNTGTGTATYTVISNGDDLGEGRFIRDLGNTYSTGSLTGVVCSGTAPTTCTATGTGTLWASLCPGGIAPCTMTTFDPNATGSAATGLILTNNHVICPASGAHDGYDWCAPITQITDDTHLTSNVFYAGNAGNAGWPYTAASAYVIYGSTYPNSIDRFTRTFTGCGVTYLNVKTCDVTGLTNGHAWDQVMAYNGDFIGLNMFFTKHIGRPRYGGGIEVLNGNTAAAPSFLYGIDISSYNANETVYGVLLGSGGTVPGTGLAAEFDPPTALLSTLDSSSAAASILNGTDQSNANYTILSYDHRTSGSPRFGIFGTKTAPAVLFDSSGNETVASITNTGTDLTGGNMDVRGVFRSANISNGPYSNQAKDSNLQSVCASTCTWTTNGSGTFTSNAGLDVFGNSTALSVTGGVGGEFEQTIAGVTMVTGNTYAVSVYAYTSAGTVAASLALNTSGSDAACQAGGGPGMPSSFTLTTTITKLVAYCSPSIASDALKMQITSAASANTVFFSIAEVAGSPFCSYAAGTCTTTGPPVITTAAAVSGTGLLLGGAAALPNGTAATTQTTGDNTTKVATDAFVQAAVGLTTSLNVPRVWQFLGDGADGSNTTASGNASGNFYYTNYTVPNGNTVTVNSWVGLRIHATGTCTINGTINARGLDTGASNGVTGATGGSGGGGTLIGAVGGSSNQWYNGLALLAGPAAGTAGGGVGQAGGTPTASSIRSVLEGPPPGAGAWMGGATGGAGGSSGGAGGFGGSNVILICGTITGNGTINVSGKVGTDSTGNNVGSGGGGGGGVVILSGQSTSGWTGTITLTGGSGGSCGAFTGCGAGGLGGTGWSRTFTW